MYCIFVSPTELEQDSVTPDKKEIIPVAFLTEKKIL